MNNNFGLFLFFIVAFIVMFYGVGVSEAGKMECRMAMAKVNRTMPEIKEICK